MKSSDLHLEKRLIEVQRRIASRVVLQDQFSGEAEPLIYKEKIVGYGILSRKGSRPIVVAPGRRISADSALEATRRCLRGQKLPEPCRLAHEHANRI